MSQPREQRIIDKIQGVKSQSLDSASGRFRVAIVGGNLRAASILRLLSEADNVEIVAVSSPNPSAPATRLAVDLGLLATPDFTEIYQIPALDLIIDISDDEVIQRSLKSQRPAEVELIGSMGSGLIWDLLVAKKRGEEQEKLFVELQVAYDRIRSHERNLQENKVKLERTNEELERRLAEIFFTHEFFKALTSYSRVDDISSLIVDGANGILGAEISCVYLLSREDWTLQLVAFQGRPEDNFRHVIPVQETILGAAFRDGAAQEKDVPYESESSSWFNLPGVIRSQAAVALRTGDRVMGVLVVGSSIYRALTQVESDRLRVIGNQSSLSLQSALLHEELERLSVTDRLTELYNHGYFQQRLAEEFIRAERFGHSLSLILADIDDFKAFNDTYGHPRGDKVLRTVSEIIRNNLREIDVAARYGGEEFVVVLPETDAEGALAVAERIRREVESTEFMGGHDIPPVRKTISLGVASFPGSSDRASGLLEEADRAMYIAKRAGKNQTRTAGQQ